MKVVILAAGMGMRLGEVDLPKPLTKLANKKSILEFQLENLQSVISLDNVLLVIGYKKEEIMESFPDLLYVYNSHFSEENTAKSLLRAIKKIHNEDVLWMNGDVVFHPSLPKKIIDFNKSCMLVNEDQVAEEEVKYTTDVCGRILQVSKSIPNALGEALGINLCRKEDLGLFKSSLEMCSKTDYFERGIEISIDQGVCFYALTTSNDLCTEIDFPNDLLRANSLIRGWNE